MSAPPTVVIPQTAAPPPRNDTPARAANSAGADSGYYRVGETNHRTGIAPAQVRRRLPAYGRQLKAALDRELRPRKGGGSIVVTTEWDYAQYFDAGRVVCPPGDSADEFDFTFLAGCEVIVLVHERDEPHGRLLLARIKEAGAKLAVLSVNREVEEC